MSCFINISTSEGNLMDVFINKNFEDIRMDDVFSLIKEKGKYVQGMSIYGYEYVVPSFLKFYERYAPKENTSFQVKDFYLKALDKSEKENADLVISTPRNVATYPITILEVARALYCGKSVLIPFDRTRTRDKILNSLAAYGINDFRIIGKEENSITITMNEHD